MLFRKKKLTTITALGSSMRKFRLADGIQPLAQICPMYNVCEGRFFPQQYLQTYPAVSQPQILSHPSVLADKSQKCQEKRRYSLNLMAETNTGNCGPE